MKLESILRKIKYAEFQPQIVPKRTASLARYILTKIKLHEVGQILNLAW